MLTWRSHPSTIRQPTLNLPAGFLASYVPASANLHAPRLAEADGFIATRPIPASGGGHGDVDAHRIRY